MSHLRKSLGVALAAALLAGAPIAQAVAGVVVSVSGPSAKTYPVGKKVAATDKIVLKAGDSVTVLDEKGTRVLRGAGTFTLASQAGGDRSSAFAMLTRQRSAARVRTGAVRGVGDEAITRPNLWYVDVRQAGPMCVSDPLDVRLWRPATSGEQLYAIGVGGAKVTTKANFSDGDMVTVWDVAQAPITDGARYVLAGGDGKPNEITFRVLPSVPDSPEALASALLERGCTGQVEVLSQAMTDPLGADAPS